MDSRTMRRNFVAGLITGLRVVWPILSVLLGLIIAAGLGVGMIEGWSIHESIYFAFVSGLTIGYGDLAPKLLFARVLAIVIGVCGVLVTAGGCGSSQGADGRDWQRVTSWRRMPAPIETTPATMVGADVEPCSVKQRNQR